MDDAELEKLANAYKRAEAKADELRPQVFAAIYAYKQAHGDRRGWQTDLVNMTGLTRERIRQIVVAEEKRHNESQ